MMMLVVVVAIKRKIPRNWLIGWLAWPLFFGVLEIRSR